MEKPQEKREKLEKAYILPSKKYNWSDIYCLHRWDNEGFRGKLKVTTLPVPSTMEANTFYNQTYANL